MKSSSLKMLKGEIPSPREYRDTLVHEWYLPDWITAEHLSAFFVRTLPASTLNNIIKDGEIIVAERSYSVIWLNGPAKIRRNGMCIMSFRYCKHLRSGYVLIKEYLLTDDQKKPEMLILSMEKVRTYP